MLFSCILVIHQFSIVNRTSCVVNSNTSICREQPIIQKLPQTILRKTTTFSQRTLSSSRKALAARGRQAQAARDRVCFRDGCQQHTPVHTTTSPVSRKRVDDRVDRRHGGGKKSGDQESLHSNRYIVADNRGQRHFRFGNLSGDPYCEYTQPHHEQEAETEQRYPLKRNERTLTRVLRRIIPLTCPGFFRDSIPYVKNPNKKTFEI